MNPNTNPMQMPGQMMRPGMPPVPMAPMAYPTYPPAVLPQPTANVAPTSTVTTSRPELSRSLYVGNLDPRVTEQILYDIFSTIGRVEMCKVIKDKTTGISQGYGFVDYTTHEAAAQALEAMNGRLLFGLDMRVGWAHSTNRAEDIANAHHVFVGDLSPDIDDKTLWAAFSPFGSLIEARVMWDPHTGRSRGYGFVAFRNREDAERAIREMNGEFLGSRNIRVNWANQRSSRPGATGDLNTIMSQASPTNVTVYVGNLDPAVPDDMIRAVFQPYGVVEELRLQKDKGFCFVKYASHEQAARAILNCNGKVIGTKAVKCAWGKEKDSTTVPTYPVYGYGYPGYGAAPYYQGAPAPATAGAYGYGYSAPQYQQPPPYWGGVPGR